MSVSVLVHLHTRCPCPTDPMFVWWTAAVASKPMQVFKGLKGKLSDSHTSNFNHLFFFFLFVWIVLIFWFSFKANVSVIFILSIVEMLLLALTLTHCHLILLRQTAQQYKTFSRHSTGA